MKKTIILFSSLLFLLILSCKSETEDDCTKTIVTRPEYNFQSQFGTLNYPELTQEVACDFPEPIDKIVPELIRLKEFSYEIIEFKFTNDTGNNTSRLEYKIKLNNLSSKKAIGVPYVTLNMDDRSFSSPYTEGCSELEASSSCIITRDAQASLDLGFIKDIIITNVAFAVVE